MHSIYLPPFKEHYIAAKNFHSNIPDFLPETLQDYEEHIDYINKNYSTKIMLLLQQNNYNISNELLKYYINLGITKFCVGSLEQANIIKDILPTAEITGSITMKIDKDKLAKDNYDAFDNFVLWFPFNRDIQKIIELPKNFKYTLLVNCKCSKFCNGTQHWLATNYEEEYGVICPKEKDNSFASQIYIPVYDIKYFEPYISYIKLQGREFTLQNLINDITFYHSNMSYYIPTKPNYDPYIIYNIPQENKNI